MTQEAQCIAIAEACGLTVIKTPFTPSLVKAKGCVFTDDARNEWRKAYPNSAGVYGIPDYLNDLNAMHEAEKVVGPIKGIEFCYHLNEMGMSGEWELLTATAAQRAEAFLRTLNLWRDDV